MGAPASAVLYSSKRTARYLRLETLVAEAISAAHNEVPDAKPLQIEVHPNPYPNPYPKPKPKPKPKPQPNPDVKPLQIEVHASMKWTLTDEPICPTRNPHCMSILNLHS